MRLVIEIDEIDYEIMKHNIANNPLCPLRQEEIVSKIAKGTPLPAPMQTDILDKIAEELADTCAYEQKVHGKTEFFHGINYCLSVIEKYKGE